MCNGFSRFRRSIELRCSTCSHVGAGPSGLRSPPPYFLSMVFSAIVRAFPNCTCNWISDKRKGPLARPRCVAGVLFMAARSSGALTQGAGAHTAAATRDHRRNFACASRANQNSTPPVGLTGDSPGAPEMCQASRARTGPSRRHGFLSPPAASVRTRHEGGRNDRLVDGGGRARDRAGDRGGALPAHARARPLARAGGVVRGARGGTAPSGGRSSVGSTIAEVMRSAYAKLGFDIREPLVVMNGPPIGKGIAGSAVRPATGSDLDACNRLCRQVHGHDRGGEANRLTVSRRIGRGADGGRG